MTSTPLEETDATTTVNVTMTIPTNLYRAAQAISLLSGYNNFEDYLVELIRQDVKMELDGSGRLALTMVDEDVKKMLLGEREFTKVVTKNVGVTDD